jgi:uncharacterized protein YecE (DUF72 family)
MPKYRIGCSGFLYDSWRGTFYPDALHQKKWLSYYVEHFDTVELNVTFYRLLKKEAFERWYKETPPDFSFSLKGSRFITHIKKLKDVELPLLTFFNTTAPLMEKFEVVLWQLPPNFRANMKNLEDFIETIKLYPVRHVFEFRHKSWVSSKVLKLLTAANIGVCMADWPDFINELPITSDFVYIRRHGEFGIYATNYTHEQLKNDAKNIIQYLKQGKDVYVYFNNDALGYAPKNARELKTILEGMLPKSLRKEKAHPKRKIERAKPAKKAKKTKKAKVQEKKPKAKKKLIKPKKKPVKKKTTKKQIRKKKTVKKKQVKKLKKKKIVKKPVKKTVKTVQKKKVTKKTKKRTVKPARKKKISKKVTKKKTRTTKKRRR